MILIVIDAFCFHVQENDYGLVSVYTSMCNRFLSFTSDHTKITSKMDEEQMKEVRVERHLLSRSPTVFL